MFAEMPTRHRPAGFLYSSIEDFVLKHGTMYTKAQSSRFIPRPKECFGRAYTVATRKGSPWIYVEGYAVNSNVGLPVPHAWVTQADTPGEAFELAWDDADSVYLGIAFRPEYVRQVHIASKRKNYSVLDAWWIDFPLISGVQDLAEVRA
jgi:hypothetical protein